MFFAQRTTVAGFALILAAIPDFAQAQAKLDAAYSITLARFPIGTATASAEIGDGRYSITTSGRASGVMRILTSGEGTLATSGELHDGRPAPSEFTARTTTDDDTLDVKLAFEGGNVRTLTASAPPPSPDRIALTEAHRQGVVDPLTALLIPAGDSGSPASQAACDRTLPVFDGRRRFDLKLTFKRMDNVKADKGYAGPAVVCAVTFQPVAGHRTSSPMIKYLADGRDIEIAFAPAAGMGMLAPFRLSVSNMLGNLTVQATRFEVTSPASVRAGATPGPAQ